MSQPASPPPAVPRLPACRHCLGSLGHPGRSCCPPLACSANCHCLLMTPTQAMFRLTGHHTHPTILPLLLLLLLLLQGGGWGGCRDASWPHRLGTGRAHPGGCDGGCGMCEWVNLVATWPVPTLLSCPCATAPAPAPSPLPLPPCPFPPAPSPLPPSLRRLPSHPCRLPSALLLPA